MFSATNVANFLACRHTGTLYRAELHKEISKPFFKDRTVELLQMLGLEHERRYLKELTERNGGAIVEIDVSGGWAKAAEETTKALTRGVDAVYQATFLDSGWGGRADFLIRVDPPSAFGQWSYEVVETKLARSTKAGALVQLCFYSDLLTRIQGTEPRWMHVVLGGRASPECFSVQRYMAYFRKVRNDFEAAWKLAPETYSEPTERCEVCSWFAVCDARRRKDDHLSLVAGISRNQRMALLERNISTVVDLGKLTVPVVPKIDRIGTATLLRIHDQARLQVKGREENQVCYELLQPIEPEKGLCVLPLPSPNDLFLDLEANPYVLDEGLEYLIGILMVCGDPQYESIWSFDRAQEKRAFQTFIEIAMGRWAQDPAMHIYHYAPYEPTAMKRLAGRHSVCVAEVDELLRAGVFVDLYRAVRQGVRASVESYSIKKLEALYRFTRGVPLREANVALSNFEAALALGDGRDKISDPLKTVEGYNRDDCFSAFQLRRWLEERRVEVEQNTGQSLPRPPVKSGKPGIDLAAQLDEVGEVKQVLLGTLPQDESQWTDEDRARWLLAQMLEWHRREEKSAWWEFFRLCGLSDEELQEDESALGGLEYVGEVERIKRSVIHRYRFPPQDHAIDRALDVRDPRTQKGVGEVVAIDQRGRTIDIKRSMISTAPHPTALIPYDIVDSGVLRESLLRLGKEVATFGIVGYGQLQCGRSLLARKGPDFLNGGAGALIGSDGRATEVAERIVRELAEKPAVLPIQGPPGTGKTFTGARLVLELVKQGRRVGITAVSHKVISNLLREVCRAAAQTGLQVRAIQKSNDRDGCNDPAVTQTKDNGAVLAALTTGGGHIAGGTAWLWARPEMAGSVDVLLVDEAGQMSLANVVAISQAATSIVLLGDPQQLDQPQRGFHPPGADASALGHLLNGRATIGPDHGIFLSETRRLHRDVCSFVSDVFYDGRLVPRPENMRQRLNAPDPLDGTGLRFAAVEHFGNQNESPEEVERVASLIDGLLQVGVNWTNVSGETQTLSLDDILIVAPYNAQVSALAERLPAGARVGTVDKFQGQEAAVIFYSMATSSPEDAPRGMEFLYSLNRLNVAISRARCVAVIVASPALFEVQCKSPRQMELMNAFCRFLEVARDV
jgi:uncharacterized protein